MTSGLRHLAAATCGFALALTALASPAAAQAGQMPADIAAKLQELGRVIDPPKTAPLYAPLQEKEPYAAIKVERDISYGSHERNRLDLFVPEATSPAPRPVLIFVHGGGFVRGDKRPPGSPFYDNVLVWAARNGFVGVNMTYRLAPQAMWPAGAEDVGAAVRWVGKEIAARGGDPGRVFLMGHSAGAVHVASYVAHPQFHTDKGTGLAGAILVSGLYDLTSNPASDAERAYFGTDAATYKERSSLPGLLAGKLPLLATMAELDPPPFVQQFNQLKDSSCSSPRGCIATYVLPQHSHISEAYSLNTPDTRLGDAILAFVKSTN